MKPLLTSIFILSFSLSFQSKAQEKEYAVTNTNDTIYGKIIRYSSFFDPHDYKFKIKDENGDKTLLEAFDVKLIRSLKGVDGDSYIFPCYNKFFVKRVINGKISLYHSLNPPLVCISKGNSTIEATDIGGFFSREKSHSQIRPLLEDNPEILKEFDTLEGSAKNIYYIIEKYNKAAE